MLRLPEIGCLPLCCVPTSFPYGSNQLHSLAGPNAFTQMNALQYCLASRLDIHSPIGISHHQLIDTYHYLLVCLVF